MLVDYLFADAFTTSGLFTAFRASSHHPASGLFAQVGDVVADQLRVLLHIDVVAPDGTLPEQRHG